MPQSLVALFTQIEECGRLSLIRASGAVKCELGLKCRHCDRTWEQVPHSGKGRSRRLSKFCTTSASQAKAIVRVCLAQFPSSPEVVMSDHCLHPNRPQLGRNCADQQLEPVERVAAQLEAVAGGGDAAAHGCYLRRALEIADLDGFPVAELERVLASVAQALRPVADLQRTLVAERHRPGLLERLAERVGTAAPRFPPEDTSQEMFLLGE